jgi:hypothetical protein
MIFSHFFGPICTRKLFSSIHNLAILGQLPYYSIFLLFFSIFSHFSGPICTIIFLGAGIHPGTGVPRCIHSGTEVHPHTGVPRCRCPQVHSGTLRYRCTEVPRCRYSEVHSGTEIPRSRCPEVHSGTGLHRSRGTTRYNQVHHPDYCYTYNSPNMDQVDLPSICEFFLDLPRLF